METTATRASSISIPNMQTVKADPRPEIFRQKEPEFVVMDEESMKGFFFMLAGIPYEGEEDSPGRWA